MSCRVAMLKMEKDGVICLPPSTQKTKPDRRIKLTSTTDPQSSVVCPVHRLPELNSQIVTKATSALWNEYIERYHYLGHKPLPGAQLRYLITACEQIVALAGFGAAVWQTAPRDQFIGWTHDQRKANLHLIVNNARFLILPWIQSKNLASKILSLITHRLPDDWHNKYNIRPVLLETFVQKNRFAGTCYKAANWQIVGETKGRGKLGATPKKGTVIVPIKDVWVYPLDSNFRVLLKST
ncbi:MAG: DUF4338 domain-containing protein [Desulfobacteraceae bacterium]|nr:DUF4338 domain-containing protein [Desulfobacteraceae bacterium]